MKKPNLGKQVLRRFIPHTTIDYVDSLVFKYGVHFKIVNPRKTKLGDCRYPLKADDPIIITINLDLPSLQFLITTIHELAHAKTFRQHGARIPAHGKEWKNNFRELFKPLLNESYLSLEDISIINHVLKDAAATSCANLKLNEHLYRDDDSVLFLKDIKDHEEFEFQNRRFVRLEKARTRYLCKELPNGKKYKIHGLANVNLVN